MGGATRYTGDVLVNKGGDELRLLVAQGGAIALLPMLVVSPGIHLQ